MGLLATIGKVFINVVSVIGGMGPLLQNLIPAKAGGETASAVITDLQAAVKIIATAEGMYAALHGGVSGGGAEKLTMAAPFIGQLILEAEPFAGKQIADHTKFEAGVRSITSGLADVLSSLKG